MNDPRSEREAPLTRKTEKQAEFYPRSREDVLKDFRKVAKPAVPAAPRRPPQ